MAKNPGKIKSYEEMVKAGEEATFLPKCRFKSTVHAKDSSVTYCRNPSCVHFNNPCSKRCIYEPKVARQPEQGDFNSAEIQFMKDIADLEEVNKELVEALRGAVFAFNNFTTSIDNAELSKKVAKGIISADRVLAKYKGDK